jgi:hypothetical protein
MYSTNNVTSLLAENADIPCLFLPAHSSARGAVYDLLSAMSIVSICMLLFEAVWRK